LPGFFDEKNSQDDSLVMIAQEAHRYLTPLIIIAVLVQVQFGFYATPIWLLAVVIAYLFRMPAYNLTSDPLGLLSPADSVVTSVSNAHDPYLDRDAIRIEFEMGMFDPYILRSVTEGKISNFWLRQPNSDSNERVRAAWIRTDEDDDAVMVVHPSRSKQMMCYYAAGERVGQGKKCGFLPLGSKIEVYLPEDSIIEVKQGDKVTAGKDIIAHWNRS